MTTKVFLVGYMGCGKSTLARKLSRRTGVRAVDTDAEVERMEGASVGDIFRYEGEERFRELERSVVERVAASGEACIVATGGGLPTWSDNMEMLSKAGTTVYLRRSAERIAARLTPYYAQAALVLDCDTLSDEEAVERIIHYLEGNE